MLLNYVVGLVEKWGCHSNDKHSGVPYCFVVPGGLVGATILAYKIIPRKLATLVSAIKRTFARKEIPIINRDNITAYSAADELLKWQQLKTSGAVSEEEFETAKRRILNKS